MKRYNLLFTSLSGQMVGGGQKSLLLLLERLDKTKFKPFLVCPAEGGLVEKAEKLGIETKIIKMGGLKNVNIFRPLTTIRRLREFILQAGIHLVHTDAPRQTFYAGLAVRNRGIPLVWHARVSDTEKRLYDRFLFNLSSKIIAVSQAVKKRFEKFRNEAGKCVVIYNGVDLKEFRPRPGDRKIREEFRIAEGWMMVGTMGQLLPRKGQDVFLKAAALVARGNPGVRFLVVGNGNQGFRKELEKLAVDLGIRDRVVFTGYRQDIQRLLSVVDIVVVPSTDAEGFSRAIIEAMACARPVIATAVGGNSEAVEEGTTGFLISPDNPHQLSDALQTLIADEKRRKQMGEAARARAERLFSINAHVARIEEVYEELLCRGT